MPSSHGVAPGIGPNGYSQAVSGATTPGRPAGAATMSGPSVARPTCYSGYVTPLPDAHPPAGAPLAPPPKPPENLTAGLPTPDEIDRQKEGYAKGIDRQFVSDADALSKTHAHYTDFLYSQAEQTKAQMILAIDQQVKQQELMMSQKYNEQLMILHQAAQRQRADLEQQANCLSLEYHTRKTQEEFMRKQYSLEKERYDSQMKIHNELQRMCESGEQLPVSAALRPPMSPHMSPPMSTGQVSVPAASEQRSASWMPPPAMQPAGAGAVSCRVGPAPAVQAMAMLPGGVAPLGTHAGRTIPEQLDRLFEKIDRQISSARTTIPSYSVDASFSAAGSSYCHSRAGSYCPTPGSVSASAAGSYHAPSPAASSYHAAPPVAVGSYHAPPMAAGPYSAVYGPPCSLTYGATPGSSSRSASRVTVSSTSSVAVPANRNTPGALARAQASYPSNGSITASVQRRPEEVNKYARPALASGTLEKSSSWRASSQVPLNTYSEMVSPGCPPAPQSPAVVAVGVKAFVGAHMDDVALPVVETNPSASKEVRNHLDASVGLR